MAEASNIITHRFNQTLDLETFERLKAIAAKKSEKGKQMKVQDLIRIIAADYAKNESL